MAFNAFTPEQINKLKKNPYTLYVSERQMRFTLEFKEKFMQLLISGKTIRGIFLELGYDPEILGNSRMGNVSTRIQKEAKAPEGLHEGNTKHFPKPDIPEYDNLPTDKAMARMQHELLYMRQELEFIKKIINPDNYK